jgi:large subunit ribosomal protein L31
MKTDIHPKYHDITVQCSCGNSFTTRSTMSSDTMNVDVCSACHPYYTGQQKILDTGGRVDKFRRRYGM